MIGPSKIWICMIGIIIICTVASGLMWQNFGQASREQQKQSIKESMSVYQSEKEAVHYIQNELSIMPRITEYPNPGVVSTRYLDSGNKTVAEELYVNGTRSLIRYDVDLDGRYDVVYFFKGSGSVPASKEYDLNRDGVFEVSEKDQNNDGIFDSNEMMIRIDGQFMPFTTVNALIM